MYKPNQRARIFLVDDHPAVRYGLTLLLGHDGHAICGENATIADTLDTALETHADLAIVDLSLGEESGFDLITELRAQKIPVLVYSMHEDAESIYRSLRSGASGYVSKREEADILRSAVQALLNGEYFMSPCAAEALANRIDEFSGASNSQLSEREQQILILLGQGCGPSEIAETMSISVRTVESYCTRIIEKLALSGMKDLRQYAIRLR